MPYSSTHDVCVASKKGEDAHAFITTTIGAEPILLALVADGHGGAKASLMLADQLLGRIVSEATGSSTTELERAMTVAFTSLHAEIRASSPTHGSTATVVAVCLSAGTITCGNVGDSFAYGFSHGSSPADRHPLHLTTSHRLEECGVKTEEARRIMRGGGKVARAARQGGQPAGPLRAWPGGLAMGRAIGDGDCGDWLIPTPSTYSCQLPDQGCDICLASDGIWDAVPLPDAYALIERWPPLTRSAKDLVDAAVHARGLHDDITAMLLRIEPEAADGADSPTTAAARSTRRWSPLGLRGLLPGRSSPVLSKPPSWHDEYWERAAKERYWTRDEDSGGSVRLPRSSRHSHEPQSSSHCGTDSTVSTQGSSSLGSSPLAMRSPHKGGMRGHEGSDNSVKAGIRCLPTASPTASPDGAIALAGGMLLVDLDGRGEGASAGERPRSTLAVRMGSDSERSRSLSQAELQGGVASDAPQMRRAPPSSRD